MGPARRGRKSKAAKAASVDTETTCQVCFAEFLDPDDLAQHYSLVHQPLTLNPYKCNFCDARETDIEAYLIHIRDKHFADLFSCLYCARAFVEKSDHKEHEEKHRSDVSGMLACSNCTVLFNSVNALENHEQICNVDCPKSVMLQKYYAHLSSILNMKADEFLQSLGNETQYTCCICHIVTSDVKVFLKHNLKNRCRSLACNNCHQIFPNKMTIHNHMTYHVECSHMPNGLRPKKQCKKCKQMLDVDIYKTHFKRCKVIKCVTCCQVFETVKELTDHQRTLHPMALTLHTCRYCRQKLAGLKLLRKHMKRNHRDYSAYKYTCAHCPEIFKHPNLLFNHFYLKHKELKPFSCKICNETFQIRRKFSLHIKLKHDSVGFVESDEQFNVHFCSEKSATPFKPKVNARLFNDDEKLSGDSDETDIEFEVETQKKMSKKKKASVLRNTRVKSESSVLLNASETEGETNGNQDKEAERRNKIEPLTRKRRRLQREIDEFESSDDESLLAIRKRAKKKRQMQIQMTKINKHKFSKNISSLTCNICKKTCFTVATYHRHMTTHFNKESKQCTLCPQTFDSKCDLHKHMKAVHSVSQITETLKKVLERRKAAAPLNQLQVKQAQPMSYKFQKTVRKVVIPPSESEAILRSDEKKLSVRNFLESFTPEVNEGGKKNVINDGVTVTPLEKERARLPKIKLRKFVETVPTENAGLKMPVPFFDSATSDVKASIKLHHGPCKTAGLNFGTPVIKQTNDYEDYQDYKQDETYFEDDTGDHNATIPEVAQEVMLENTEEQNARPAHLPNIAHQFILPKTNHKIKIAHLQLEAPFFKIVPIDDIVEVKPRRQIETPSEIRLPSGTKLVHANPLAHLLQGKSLEDFRKSSVMKQKYYQPKHDHSAAIAKALMDMENPKPRQKRPYQKRAPRKKKVSGAEK